MLFVQVEQKLELPANIVVLVGKEESWKKQQQQQQKKKKKKKAQQNKSMPNSWRLWPFSSVWKCVYLLSAFWDRTRQTKRKKRSM